MTDTDARARKLQLKPGSTLWIWPVGTATEHLAVSGFEGTDIDEADVAIIFAANQAEVDEVLAEHGDALAKTRVVWIVYAKGNKTDMNRDTLWVQLAEHGFKAVSQVSYSTTLSALRVRLLKDSERAPA
ncbi:hypothetical protein SAMN02745244_00463 [Tessaracoccus bendigoensis DSM 12906]|uniref:DUF3052 domain-containing protein n=1 Tax=Tessaracoccus bendigoensis DSM 12906 TaxID=1123357 RepID=A0A1M6BKQ2_9ACTN|nr:hypothetical protein [Tessaracoccus bendigoensis]SHI49158.1 hypothetical protein SAMN02745244_00463 [Tessaracoccus bendigoensis DSM 12906]